MNRSDESSAKTLLVALRAAVYMTGFFFVFGWLALSVRVFDPSFGITLPSWMALPGLVLMIAGGALGLLCAGEFIARGRGTPAPFDPPRKFVPVGPYRYVRNPMYVGGLAFLVGLGLYLHSLSILFLSLLLWAVVHLFVVYYEEPTLKKTFGAEYEAYRQAVPRWIARRPR